MMWTYPGEKMPKKDRDWILFTDEQPQVPVYAGFNREEVQRAIKRKMEPSYMGTFTGARKYVLHTFAHTQSALMKKRVSQYMLSSECPTCNGKRLRTESLSVKFAGMDIADLSRLPWQDCLLYFSLMQMAVRQTLQGLPKTMKKKRWWHNALPKTWWQGYR
jgi:excinuclease ABC subunit A